MMDDNKVWRAQTYGLLANLLSQAPNQLLLDNMAAIEVIEPRSPMGQQWLQLSSAAKQADVEAVYDEYQALFIGVTQGEIIPYGSYYQTGFLMEEPLAELRTDLARLGLEKQKNTAEPEDHVAAQCDVMRMILTAEGVPIVTAEAFFQHHLKPWVAQFFQDLANAESAGFYRTVGLFGETFMRFETRLLAG